MSKLTKEEVEHIAELARLRLKDEEKNEFVGQLSSILDYIAKLQEVDISKVSATAHVFDTKNVVRDDEVKSCSPKTQEILLSDLPERDGNLLKVPAVFESSTIDF